MTWIDVLWSLWPQVEEEDLSMYEEDDGSADMWKTLNKMKKRGI